MTKADDAQPGGELISVDRLCACAEDGGHTIKNSPTLHTAGTRKYNLSLMIRPSFLNLSRKPTGSAVTCRVTFWRIGLIWLDRPVEYFSSVREPVAQLVSHLNFSFERSAAATIMLTV